MIPHTPLPATLSEGLRLHWPEYLMEAAETGVLLLVTCASAVTFLHPGSPIAGVIPSLTGRRIGYGLATAIASAAIIWSLFGRRSGGHFNPAITLTFFRLRKVTVPDTVMYVLSQFMGGILGVLLAIACFGTSLAHPRVRYAATLPGTHGIAVAFAADAAVAFVTMSAILYFANTRRFMHYVPVLAGLLSTAAGPVFVSISHLSINPARSFASAVFADLWLGIWIYFTAPLLGMLLAAELYLRVMGAQRVYCAKLYHDTQSPCPFRCRIEELLEPAEMLRKES